MSHMSPFRLNVPNLGADLSSGVSNPKKRRKNGQNNIQTPPNVQDLLPPPLSGYGDTIVASNPFDDCPSSMTMSMVRNPNPMGMGNSMPMGMNPMNMCRPMGTSTDAQLISPVSVEQSTSVSGQEKLSVVVESDTSADVEEKSSVVAETGAPVDAQEKLPVVTESGTLTGAQDKSPTTVVPDTAAEKKSADAQPMILIVATPDGAQEKSPVAVELNTLADAKEKIPLAVEPGTSIDARENSPIIEPINAVPKPDSAIATESYANTVVEYKVDLAGEQQDSTFLEPAAAAVATLQKSDSDSSTATDEWITVGPPTPSDIVGDLWSSISEPEKMPNAPEDNKMQTAAKHEDKAIAQTQNIANNEAAANVEEASTSSDDDSGSPAKQQVVGKNETQPASSALMQTPHMDIIDITHSSSEDESTTKEEPAQNLSEIDLQSTDDEDGANIDEAVKDTSMDGEFKVPLPSCSNAEDAAASGGGPQLSGMPPHHAHQSLMMNGPRMNGPPMNGPPMGNPMVPHMIPSPNGPMHGPIPGPIPSPINNMGPSPMSGPMQGNGPINGPMMSPMGPMNNGGPLGPMNSPLNGPMNGPGPMNGMSSPMNGPINGMGGNMNSPMGGPPPCPMNHPGNQGPMNNNFMMPMNNMYQKPLPVSAGKVYPADQPMVFNSQNPNAPPIYPCGVCHKEVHDNDQAILCESGCNFWFHRGCTGLTETAYQMLTAEVYAEWVCDKCLSSKNIPLVKFKP